jgi:hypothetical protein
MHITRRNATISQKFMDKEECNNITKIHGQGGMQKFMDKKECKNPWTWRNAKIF